MWLDAFIKPNSKDMQKTGVNGVNGVKAPRKPNEYKGLAETTPIDTEIKTKCQSVSVVSKQISLPSRLTPLTPIDTWVKTACQDNETPRKPNEYKGLAIPLTPLTPLTPQKHNVREIAASNLEALEQFRFDLVQQEIDAGHPADELCRVNNMAWEFMQFDGIAFDEAITKAAEIVAKCDAATCEAAYTDVMTLFKKVNP